MTARTRALRTAEGDQGAARLLARTRLARRLAAAALVGLLLALAGCTRPTAAPAGARLARGSSPRGAHASPTGRWYRLVDGRLRSVAQPTPAPLKPWTVQSRIAAFAELGSTLYLAVNGWGLLALQRPSGAPLRTTPFERERLFGGRTITGLFVEGGKLVINLYRNTVFSTPPPQSGPLAYVRFSPTDDRLAGVALPPSAEGWEATEVLHVADGKWAIAWKRSGPKRVAFRYTLYDPASGEELSIDRSRFRAAYAFTAIAQAPEGIRRLAAAIEAAEGPDPKRVTHLLLRGASPARIERYRSGSEARLAAGEAHLATIPAISAGARRYALLADGRVVWAADSTANGPGATGILTLPPLPAGFAYTGLWTDGGVLLVSWEQQHFASVGAAGLYVEPLPGRAGASRGA